MKRGDVITMSARGGVASKPRPGVVVQAAEFIVPGRPVLVCPLTSELSDAPFFRIDISPSEENGLRVPSQAMVDRLSAILSREIGMVIGRLGPADLTRIEFALTNILGLASAAALMSRSGAGS